MRKRLSLTIFAVCIFLLCACNGNRPEHILPSSSESAAEAVLDFPYVGEWKAKVIVSNIENVKEYGVSVICINSDGTGTYNSKEGKWIYNADEKAISLTLIEGGAAELMIAEEEGKTVLKFYQDTYYRAEEFVE